MNYPEDIESRLGFDQIKAQLKTLCKGQAGQGIIDQIRFSTDSKSIQSNMSLVSELTSMMTREVELPLGEYDDIHSFIKNLNVDGFYLSTEDLVKLRKFLNVAETSINFIFSNKDDFPTLQNEFSDIVVNISLLSRIDSTIDESGNVKSTASPELSEIRKDLHKVEDRLRKTADKFIQWAQKQKYTDEEVQPTIRNGRMVVPIYAEYKRKIDGLIHDESGTGQTIFFEPAEMTGINNDVKELLHREKREIIKILVDLSRLIHSERETLTEAFFFVAQLDALHAKALFCNSIGAEQPMLIDSPCFEWREARHPLLTFLFNQKGGKVIPFDYELNEDKKFLIISGPNAGGKSVCLTAIGLIQYMIQCGIPVPMNRKSRVGIFQKIYLDIGDQQSVDNDLSTYSAHLSNMNYFLNNSQPDTLILMDEYGTGTDPNIGGALAEVMLDELLKKGAHGVVTTHYSAIKKMAESHPDVENGAMLFDGDSLSPTFQLDIGRAGSSYTFEVARKMGIQERLISVAKEKVGEFADFDKILMELETENRKLKEKMKDLESQDSSMKKSYSELKELSGHLKGRKEEIIEQAKREAAQIIKNANRDVEAAIREIKESKADKTRTKEARDKLGRKIETLTESKVSEKPEHFEVGDFVRIKNSETTGEVIEVSDKSLTIKSGDFISRVKPNLVIKSKKKEGDTLRRKGYLSAFDKTEFRNSIDLRGMKVGDALTEVDKLLDKALLYGESRVTILHGKGSGALRNSIRDYLQKYDFVKSYEDEKPENGGDGITIVNL